MRCINTKMILHGSDGNISSSTSKNVNGDDCLERLGAVCNRNQNLNIQQQKIANRNKIDKIETTQRKGNLYEKKIFQFGRHDKTLRAGEDAIAARMEKKRYLRECS